ncbi:Cwf21, partial [Ostertagia ostertagi]
MYNGIGLQTARGSGTNGYVQANLSSLLLSKKRVEYNSEADIRRAEAQINKGPNEEILQHQRKRIIEMKCAEFEMLMEEKGFDDDEIQKKVSDYRKLLLSQLESGELNLDAELGTRDSHARAKAAAKGFDDDEIQKKVSDYRKLLLSQLESGELNLDAELGTRDSHARAKAAAKNRDKMRDALGLSKDFVPGKSMENMKKTDVVGAALAAPVASAGDSLLSTLKKEMKEKSDKDKKRKKRRHESTSSSSSSSDSNSSEDSSDDSSSSDSDESSSSGEVKRKRAKKVEVDKKKTNEKKDGSSRDRRSDKGRDRQEDDKGRSSRKDKEERSVRHRAKKVEVDKKKTNEKKDGSSRDRRSDKGRDRQEDDKGRSSRKDKEERSVRHRKDEDRHDSSTRKNRTRSPPRRSPSDDSRKRKTRDGRDKNRRGKSKSPNPRRKSQSPRRRSRSPRDRERRTVARDKSPERSPIRQIKEEPRSSDEEEQHNGSSEKQSKRLAGGRESCENPVRSDHESASDSNSCDSWKYKMKSTYLDELLSTAGMAFSDEQELIDQIRHELRMEDDTGTCARVVAPERRRAKYGGLPLNFRMTTSSDEEDLDRGDPYYYEIPLVEDPVPTREIIEERLRSRTGESGDAMGFQTANVNKKSSDELFVTKEVEPVKKHSKRESAVS